MTRTSARINQKAIKTVRKERHYSHLFKMIVLGFIFDKKLALKKKSV